MKKAFVLWNFLLFASLTGYFFLMRLLGLHDILELRYLNLFFTFGIVYVAMKQYRAHTSEAFSFWATAMAGARAAIPAVVGFALFQFFYLRFMDPAFMAYIKAVTPMGEFLSPPVLAWFLVAEGVLGTFFSAYVGMRLIAAQEKAKFPAL
jgi:hypothetical protein